MTFLLQLFNSAAGHPFFHCRRSSLLHRHSHLLTLCKMAASVEIDNGTLTLKYHEPNLNRREWIRRFLSNLGKFIVDSFVNNSLLRLKGNIIVEDGKFVRDPVKFSKEYSPFGQTFNDFPSSFKKGNDSNTTVVDVEAEIRDAD